MAVSRLVGKKYQLTKHVYNLEMTLPQVITSYKWDLSLPVIGNLPEYRIPFMSVEKIGKNWFSLQQTQVQPFEHFFSLPNWCIFYLCLTDTDKKKSELDTAFMLRFISEPKGGIGNLSMLVPI